MKTVFLAMLLLWLTNAYRISEAPVIDNEIMSVNAERRYNDFEFSRFVRDLGFRESGNNWQSINLIGCFGEWQFSEATLQFLGYKNVTLNRFREDPNIFPRETQLEALKELIRWNLYFLKEYEEFIGDTIKGVVISRSGMIAASHLGGAGTLMKYLDSNGKVNKADVLGTSIYDYMERFSGYKWN